MIRRLSVSQEALDLAARALRDGQVICVPTQRWYMVCCDAANSEQVRAIHVAKKRPLDRPLLLVVPTPAALFDFFSLGPHAQTLVERLVPGELTMCVQWREEATRARYLSGQTEETLAACVPGILGEVAHRHGRLLAATSANVSGPSSDDGAGPALAPKEAMAFLSREGLGTALIVDDGICPSFMPTTIVDCRNLTAPPAITRRGFVHDRAIQLALGSEG